MKMSHWYKYGSIYLYHAASILVMFLVSNNNKVICQNKAFVTKIMCFDEFKQISFHAIYKFEIKPDPRGRCS